MSGELLPCPFCGSDAIPITTRHTTRCELLTDCAGGMNEVPVEYWENRATRTPPSGGEEITDNDYCDDCKRYHRGKCKHDTDGRELPK